MKEGLFKTDILTMKTLTNENIAQAKKNVPDIKVFGNGDLFQLLSKASSRREGFMKSTKACEVSGLGCIVQVTTQHGDNIAEAVCFVPGAKIAVDYDGNKKLVSI